MMLHHGATTGKRLSLSGSIVCFVVHHLVECLDCESEGTEGAEGTLLI